MFWGLHVKIITLSVQLCMVVKSDIQDRSLLDTLNRLSVASSFETCLFVLRELRMHTRPFSVM